MRNWSLVALGLCAGLLAGPAHADSKPFAWIYDWYTPHKGEFELEAYADYNSTGNTFTPQAELEYGINNRLGVGAYLIGETGAHEGFNWHAAQVEARYRLGDFAYNRLLHTGYLEVNKENASPVELEGKWLLSWYTRQHDVLAVNLIAEQKLGRHATEFQVAGGWARRFGPAAAGFETVLNLTEKQYHLGPTVTWNFTPETRLVANVSPGLTAASDRWLTRVVLRHEFF